LKSTVDFELTYKKHTQADVVHGFVDADWAGDSGQMVYYKLHIEGIKPEEHICILVFYMIYNQRYLV
jgi:hypothetical protein